MPQRPELLNLATARSSSETSPLLPGRNSPALALLQLQANIVYESGAAKVGGSQDD
jgi:hypothetical protein